jgi:hypothetical protein
MKALSWAVRDWNIAGVLRYQSGELLRTPASNNGSLRSWPAIGCGGMG